MKNYNHVFFDLDRTLWDFDTNSRETLTSLFCLSFPDREKDCELFIEKYLHFNDQLWDQYAKSRVTKEFLRLERFILALKEFGITDKKKAEELSVRYLEVCPSKTALMPYAVEVLTYLKEKYTLHIISNGFTETQAIKLSKSGLKDFFSAIITSEVAGFKKPHKGIFNYAIDQTGADVESSIMIGDHFEADILGAKEAGLDQVYFNPNGLEVNTLPTYQIRCLSEVRSFL